MGPALEVRASSISLIPSKEGTVVVRVVDTMPAQQEVIAPEVASAIIDYLKSIALLDLEDKRRIQEGAMRMVTPGGYMTVNLKVSEPPVIHDNSTRR